MTHVDAVIRKEAEGMLIVDRFEEEYVVLEQEDKTTLDVERSKFPADIQAGDVVYLEGGRYLIDTEATIERAKKIQVMMDELWE